MISALSIILMNILLLTTASVMHSGDSLNAPYGVRPVIDGLLTPGEWLDADTVWTVNLPDGPAIIYAKEYPDTVYIAVNIPDISNHPQDKTTILVDSLNNAGTLPDVDDFTCEVRRNGARTGQRGTGTGWTTDSLWGWNSAVSSSAGSWSVEYSIAYRKAGLQFYQPKTIGFSVEIYNKSNTTVFWPDSASDIDPSTWGDLYSSSNWGSTDSLGPVTSGIHISPPSPPPGITQITVYALVSDSVTGQTAIAGAEAFIDSAGQTGTGYAMLPLDGNFNEMIEDVLDTIPVSGWVLGDTHWIYVHGRDIAGNWGMFDSLPVIVTGQQDTLPPWITATFPDSGQADIALDTILSATFSEKVDPATVTADKFTVSGSINGAYTFTLNYNPIDSTVYIDPTISFASAESITVIIAPGIQDLAGNPMPDSFRWWFRTLVLPDSTGPVTSSVSVSPPNPPQGITQIISYAHVSDSTTGQSLINDAEAFLDSIGLSGTGYAMAALDGAYNEIAEDVLDTIPVSGWVAGDTHWVYVHGRDIANNWGPYDSAAVHVVTVIDTIPPGIAYTSPANGDTGVALNSWIYVTFNEKVDPATVTSDKILIEGNINGNYTFWMSYFESDSTLRINPYNDFAPMESINVYIAAGIKDLAGNPMLSGYWWWFRTGSLSDTAEPRVDSLAANPDTIIGAAGITVITSRIADNTAVVGAEYFIDALGANGTGYTAHASDGFGLTVAHTLDTIAVDTLAYGMHRFFLHGIDAAGNWGPCDTTVMCKIVVDSIRPDVDSLQAMPDTVDISDSTAITSRIADNTGIAFAEYFIDRVSGYGTGYAATPVDSFGTAIVHTRDVIKTLDTLTMGRHWVYLRGRDLAGNWSACDSVFFVVMNSDTIGPDFIIAISPSPAAIGDSVLITAQASKALHPDSAVTCLVRTADTTVAYAMIRTDSLEYSLWVQTVGFPEDTCWASVSGYDEWGTYGIDSLSFTVAAEGEFLPKNRVYAWPNPAKGSQVNFHFYVSMNARVRVAVFNLEGRRVWQSAYQDAAGGKPPNTVNSNAVVWDISHIAGDIYIFRLEAESIATGDKAVVTKKFAIVR
jgi:hypothetical protein